MKKIALALAAVIMLAGLSACKDPLKEIMEPQSSVSR